MEEISILEALQAFGLSQKEVKIYLACLELGTATANVIAEKADINRSTTYDILKVFLEKGIASKVIKEKTTHFEVASPEKLLAILEEKKGKIQAVFKQLKALQQTVTEKPMVELYEGKEGLKTILTDILSTAKQTDVISTSKIFEIFTYNFPRYIQQRKQAKIFSRVIQEKSVETNKLKQSDKTEFRETRAIPNFEIDSATFIYGGKIALLKLVEKEPIGIIIEDRTLAADQRKIFELLWKIAK